MKKTELKKLKSCKCFHSGDKRHDTYEKQRRYVQSLGNVWAMENFNATRPYFC